MDDDETQRALAHLREARTILVLKLKWALVSRLDEIINEIKASASVRAS